MEQKKNIIEKIESDNSKVIKEIDKRQSKNNNKNPLYLPPLNTNNNSERAKSLSPKIIIVIIIELIKI